MDDPQQALLIFNTQVELRSVGETRANPNNPRFCTEDSLGRFWTHCDSDFNSAEIHSPVRRGARDSAMRQAFIDKLSTTEQMWPGSFALLCTYRLVEGRIANCGWNFRNELLSRRGSNVGVFKKNCVKWSCWSKTQFRCLRELEKCLSEFSTYVFRLPFKSWTRWDVFTK